MHTHEGMFSARWVDTLDDDGLPVNKIVSVYDDYPEHLARCQAQSALNVPQENNTPLFMIQGSLALMEALDADDRYITWGYSER